MLATNALTASTTASGWPLCGEWRQSARRQIGATTTYAWDGAGRLTRLTNENGAHTHFRHDLADHLTDEIGFDGRHQRYCYNAAGDSPT